MTTLTAGFCDIPQSLQRVLGLYRKLDYARFLPHSFQFILL